MDNRQPLFNKEAEETLLGYVLVHPETLHEVEMQPEWFYIRANQEIWRAMEATERGSGLDYMTLVNELEKRGKLEEVGGAAYVTGLLSYPIWDNPERTAEIIREYAQRRSMLLVAGEIAKSAYNLQSNISSDNGKFIDMITRLSADSKGAVHWARYLLDLQNDVRERIENPGENYGIPTGFDQFDKITGGLQPGELLLLSGKPGMGKSILAMQMAAQMAQSYPGAIYSVEMSGLQVARRIVSSRSGILARQIKTGAVNEGEQRAIDQAIDTLSQLPVYMADSPNWTTTALRADLSRLKLLYGVQWFVFDYLMLAGDVPDMEETPRTQIISRNMKLICRHLDIAGLVIHSMNKMGIDAAKPDQSSLRGSGQVIYDADLICFLTDFQPMSMTDQFIKPDEQKNMRTLLFAKGRELEDPRKFLHLVKLPAYPAFGDYADPERR